MQDVPAVDLRIRLQPSLLDRLTDDQPGERVEAEDRRVMSRTQLRQAVLRQQPPRTGVVRPKLRYAHQGGMNPPLVIIHGSALNHVPDAYRRFLEHFFSDAFKLRGTPLRIQFKAGVNPYADSNARR